MDKLMAWLHKALRPMTKLGGGIEGTFPEWVPIFGGKGWKLWPFVAFAIFVLLLVGYDQWLA